MRSDMYLNAATGMGGWCRSAGGGVLIAAGRASVGEDGPGAGLGLTDDIEFVAVVEETIGEWPEQPRGVTSHTRSSSGPRRAMARLLSAFTDPGFTPRSMAER